MTPEELADRLDPRYAVRLLRGEPGYYRPLNWSLFQALHARGGMAFLEHDDTAVRIHFSPNEEATT